MTALSLVAGGPLQALAHVVDLRRAEPRIDRDRALVERHLGGDRDAFGELYRRHVDTVYQRLTRLLGPIPEREDLTQDVFLGLHRALPSFRGDALLSTLLYRIVANLAFEHMRRRTRRPTVPLEDAELDRLIAPGASPEVMARQRQELVRVLRCVEKIKPKKRIALMMRIVDGASFEEIAEIVEATPDTVAKRVQHGMRELMEHLARDGRHGAGES